MKSAAAGRHLSITEETHYYRRKAWLLVFGLCHGFLIWFGDILAHYALLALVFLYPLRRARTRVLLAIGLTVCLVGGSWGSIHAFRTLLGDAARREAVTARAAEPSAMPLQIAEAGKLRQEEAQAAAEKLRAERLRILRGSGTGWRKNRGCFSFASGRCGFLSGLGR